MLYLKLAPTADENVSIHEDGRFLGECLSRLFKFGVCCVEFLEEWDISDSLQSPTLEFQTQKECHETPFDAY